MENALIYNYNIYVNSLNKINNNYYFNFQNNNYVIQIFDRNVDEAVAIYELNKEMISIGIKTYKIILTRENNVLFLYDNNYYILMSIPNIKNRIINIDDVINFNYIPVSKEVLKIDKSNWSYYWSNKIDFIENSFYEVRLKYPDISSNINFYIGMWENGISYFNTNFVSSDKKVVCHKRIGVKSDILEFLNPMNLVVDYKERDISEYLKSYIYNNNWTIYDLNVIFSKFNFTRDNIILLISRTLFPSFYFDEYEDVINNNRTSSKIEKNPNNIIYLLKYIFNRYYHYNIPLIDWIIKEE